MEVALSATVVCVSSVLVLLASEWARYESGRQIAKTTAAIAYAVVAWSGVAGPPDLSTYAGWVRIGAVMGVLGDVALLGHSRRALATGMGFFALGHLAYIAACTRLVPPQQWFTVWQVALVLGGASVLIWLWRHLSGFRAPVALYIALSGVFLAAGWAPTVRVAAGVSEPVKWLLGIGASLFLASDIAVARHRFVTQSFWNKAWGLPVYFAAQLLIAWSAIR